LPIFFDNHSNRPLHHLSYELKDKRESYASAAKIYFRCRKKGVTINSTIDCLIAQTAIENNSYLLQNDSDFDNIARVADLKMFSL